MQPVLPPQVVSKGHERQGLLFQNTCPASAKGASQTPTSQLRGLCSSTWSILPRRSAPVGLQKMHKQVSSTRLPACSKHAKDGLCLCAGGHTDRFKRGTNSVILHMPSPPLTLSLILYKNMELKLSEKEAGQRGEGRSCPAGGSG